MAGPLSGIRVIDAGIIAVGPFVAMLLGYLGADVIRVEHPAGDPQRQSYPTKKGMSTKYICCNFCKRNLMLNLTTPDGKETILKLCEQADVFIENRGQEPMEKLGLNYEVVSQVNPRII